MPWPKLTPRQVDNIRTLRWKARTDLIWLCNNLLDYRDVNEERHGLLISRMLKFPQPTAQQMVEHDTYNEKRGWRYTPLIVDPNRLPAKLPDPNRFPGKKRALIIDYRGSLKSSIGCEGGGIQWILNYPDITMLMFQGNLERAQLVVGNIKGHFQRKPLLRELFPELRPPLEDWGTKLEFTIPGRSDGYVREQPTLRGTSIERAGAGQHVEVILWSDIVDEKNSTNDTRCRDITNDFRASQKLLVSANYFGYMEGTRYHYMDTYSQVIRDEMDAQRLKQPVFKVGKKVFLERKEAEDYRRGLKSDEQIETLNNMYVPQPEKREYSVYINGVFKRDYSKWGKPPSYDYDDLDVPLLLDDQGRPISRWEERHPRDKLIKEMENPRSSYLFSCQMLNNPAADQSIQAFPVNERFPAIISREDFRQNVRVQYYEISVDTIESVSSDSSLFAMPVAAWDSSGRCYIVEIRHGRFPVENQIEQLFELVRKYNPQRVMLEKIPFNSGLMPWINRQMHEKNLFFNIIPVDKHARKDSNPGKDKRIVETLRPWWVHGDLRFLKDIGAPLEALREEAKQFPRGYKDILDALSDLFFDKNYYGRLSVRPTKWRPELLNGRREAIKRELLDRHLQVNDIYEDPGDSLIARRSLTGGL